MMATYVDITDQLRKKIQCIDVCVRSNVPDVTYKDHEQAILDQNHKSIIFSAKKKRFKILVFCFVNVTFDTIIKNL